jgi:hypothetical protein
MKIEVWGNSDAGGPVDTHSFTLTTLGDLTVLKDVELPALTATLVDDGNGIEIRVDKKKIRLDYYEAAQVLILLENNTDQIYEFRESKIIKSF